MQKHFIVCCTFLVCSLDFLNAHRKPFFLQSNIFLTVTFRNSEYNSVQNIKQNYSSIQFSTLKYSTDDLIEVQCSKVEPPVITDPIE